MRSGGGRMKVYKKKTKLGSKAIQYDGTYESLKPIFNDVIITTVASSLAPEGANPILGHSVSPIDVSFEFYPYEFGRKLPKNWLKKNDWVVVEQGMPLIYSEAEFKENYEVIE